MCVVGLRDKGKVCWDKISRGGLHIDARKLRYAKRTSMTVRWMSICECSSLRGDSCPYHGCMDGQVVFVAEGVPEAIDERSLLDFINGAVTALTENFSQPYADCLPCKDCYIDRDSSIACFFFPMCVFNVSCPERVRLRSLLERVLNSEGSVDLRPVRRFMAALCQTSARHTQHGEQKPVMGKHACFQGTPQNPQCRYGHARFCGMISCSAASSSMCWPTIAATLTSGRV